MSIVSAVHSALAQSVQDVEVIVVDDGSSDHTVERLGTVRDSRLSVLTNPDRGLVSALNFGVAHAKSSLVARLDGDDLALPWRVGAQISAFNADETLVLLGGQGVRLGPSGEFLWRTSHPLEDLDIRWSQLFMNSFTHSAAMFRKSTFDQAGGYIESESGAEDYALWSRLALLGSVRNLSSVIVVLGSSQTSVTAVDRARVEEVSRRIALSNILRVDAGAPGSRLWRACAPQPRDSAFATLMHHARAAPAFVRLVDAFVEQSDVTETERSDFRLRARRVYLRKALKSLVRMRNLLGSSA